MYVDVHAHMHYFKEEELRLAIDKFKKVGGKVIIENGLNPRTNRTALKLARRFKCVKAALGMFPTDALEIGLPAVVEELKFISNKRDSIVAVGEVGLDYYWDKDKHKEQREVFSKVIKLCEKIRKPIIVHSRSAEEDVISMLESSRIKSIVMHCFGGRMSLTKRIRDYGWNFSIPSSVKRSVHFQRIVEEVPMAQLLSETDTPYQGPVADTRNEPANVVVVAEKIAALKGLDKEECAKMLFQNYQRVF